MKKWFLILKDEMFITLIYWVLTFQKNMLKNSV